MYDLAQRQGRNHASSSPYALNWVLGYKGSDQAPPMRLMLRSLAGCTCACGRMCDDTHGVIACCRSCNLVAALLVWALLCGRLQKCAGMLVWPVLEGWRHRGVLGQRNNKLHALALTSVVSATGPVCFSGSTTCAFTCMPIEAQLRPPLVRCARPTPAPKTRLQDSTYETGQSLPIIQRCIMLFMFDRFYIGPPFL
jgi:hypothetical protein